MWYTEAVKVHQKMLEKYFRGDYQTSTLRAEFDGFVALAMTEAATKVSVLIFLVLFFYGLTLHSIINSPYLNSIIFENI